MNAVILAAGTGSRLVNLTRDLPKALVELRGCPLIDYTLRFVKELDCRQITVVGGFYFEKLEAYIEKHHDGVQIIENIDFLKGNLFSLLSALVMQEDSFLLLNADHVFPRRLGNIFLSHGGRLNKVTAFIDFDRPLGQDDMKVRLGEGRSIRNISKNLHIFDAGYIGATYVPYDMFETYRAAAHSLAQKRDDAVVEDILQWLTDDDKAPETLDVSGVRWLEIDNQGDLLNAERILSWVPDYLD